MTTQTGHRPDAASRLSERALSALDTIAPDAMPAWLEAAASEEGFGGAVIYLADLQQTLLSPWAGGGQAEAIDTTLAGLAFRRGGPVQGGDSWWIPVTDHGDRLGVLRLSGQAPADPGYNVAAGERLAALIALFVSSRRHCTDSILLAMRTQPLSLAAEFRWSLLPPRTLTATDLCVSGHLEPAYEIAGDSYDYALNGDVLDVAVFDAMGHGMAASRLANLAMTSYRHSRRRGTDLAEAYLQMDQAVLSEFGEDVFVTAHLARLNTTKGLLQVVNAGHPHPLLIRGGTPHPLEFPIATPVGLGFTAAEVGEVRLEPGDAILILSDGVTEAHSAGGDLFGADRVGDLAVRALSDGESIPETVRRLVLSLLEHRSVALEDDASFVMLGWH